MKRLLLVSALALGLAPGAGSAEVDGSAVYAVHCAQCHGADRLGGLGPALLPGNLKRLKPGRAHKVIAQGRPASQMAGFAQQLSEAEIAALVDLIYQPLPERPVWDRQEITASHVVHSTAARPDDRPAHDADPLNLFVVVESGDHHVTILDGDRFTPITRFASRFALHGGPKFSPDGRFVYFGSRDGWVSKYDLTRLELVAEVRAGINLRNIAVSADGLWVAAANYLPHSLVILRADDLTLDRVIPVADKDGKSSRVSAVYTAPPRRSFVAAMKDIKEIWELSYDPDAPPVYGGLVHSHRADEQEGIVSGTQPFAVRRMPTEDYLDDFFFDPAYSMVFGAARDGGNGQVFHLDVRRKIADLALSGLPHLGSGISWRRAGRTVMATPHLKRGAVSVIDLESFETVKTIETLGPGFFLRSHAASPYAWVDVFFGPDRDALHVIDKESLEIVRTLRPAPGKTAAHVEFTRDGRYALVSVWDLEGAVVVYDALSLEEVTRIPMVKPSGKYNVWNKIRYAEGTSH